MKSVIGRTHCGFALIAQKPYSAAEGDWFLSMVGGVRETERGFQAVTWCYNEQVDGFAHGDYSRDDLSRREALQVMVASFNERGLQGGS